MPTSEMIKQLGTYAYMAALEGKASQEIPIELIKAVIVKLMEVSKNVEE